jgi:hypothetical protein
VPGNCAPLHDTDRSRITTGERLYQRDAHVLNKSTLEEAPVLFRAAAMTTIVTYLIRSGLLTAPIGAQVVGSVWLGLAV